ncbi:MAG: MaoC family dehydratase [Oxalobacteraceae bacterium]|nr:MaoC family dehydratase [Oxalobacteraceae bacterium]
MKFADLSSGKRITLGPLEVDADEVLAFARKYDAQWFHADPMLAEQGPWGGLIASGWHTCAMAMGLVSSAILNGSESYASPGLDYVKWPHPVRPGDLLTLHVLVHESRISASKPGLGIIRWQWIMHNQHGAEVLDLEATSLFRLPQPAKIY